jgi:hypothetical protein
MDLKIEAARRQLGTALALFLDDCDPVSVHCLASGGCEVIEHYASKSDKAFVTTMLEENSSLEMKEFRRLQKLYYNAFKHALTRDHMERDDAALLANFTDEQNDVALFIGWTDYANATGAMPIEAQVQQAWWLAKNLGKIHPQHSTRPYENLFPCINLASRTEQKKRLREAIINARSNMSVMSDPNTEKRSLVLPWVP